MIRLHRPEHDHPQRVIPLERPGHRIRIQVWTTAEWEALTDAERPDAIKMPDLGFIKVNSIFGDDQWEETMAESYRYDARFERNTLPFRRTTKSGA